MITAPFGYERIESLPANSQWRVFDAQDNVMRHWPTEDEAMRDCLQRNRDALKRQRENIMVAIAEGRCPGISLNIMLHP